MMYDVAIIGGGLAGLSLSIDLKLRGYNIIVIEKSDYPRQKVCGEYISMESYQYLHQLCPALNEHHLPLITRFELTATGKKTFETPLDLGGFGVSRYLLEELLYLEAKRKGVIFLLNNKANDISFNENEKKYTIQTNHSVVNANLVCNSTGRKSNFEVKENGRKPSGKNYVGVKYHLKIDRDPAKIEIHNFPGGYCGISNIEDNKSCLCYIVNAKYLKLVKNSIPSLEKNYLHKNERLQKIFNTAEFLLKDPVTISGINFGIKQPVRDNSIYLGDAAGSIAPIAGNGMSMALRSASVLSKYIDQYFQGEISQQVLLENYSKFWKKEFTGRIKLSRYFQQLSEYSFLTNITIGIFNGFPGLAGTTIRNTHGQPF